MSYIESALLKKNKELQELVDLLHGTVKKEEKVKGRLRISQCRNSPQYYFCATDDKENHIGVYIPQSNKQFAYELAQNEYDRRLLKKT